MEKKEFRVLIKHCFLMGKNTVETKAWVDKCYPDSAPGNPTIIDWFAEFKRGRTNTDVAARFGRPKEVVTSENIKKVHKIVLANRKAKMTEIADDTLKISKEREVCFVRASWTSRKLEGEVRGKRKIMETKSNSSSGEGTAQTSGTQPATRTDGRIKKGSRGPRQKGVDSITKKFLRNFDPEHSEREKRKLHRRLYQGHKRHVLYDEKGIYIQTGDDLCDCLNTKCSGCHFPCPKCSSTKCAHECRNNRKWTYDSIENEGSDVVMKNPILKDT